MTERYIEAQEDLWDAYPPITGKKKRSLFAEVETEPDEEESVIFDIESDDFMQGMSNSWAVHGNYTDSGNPLMANDLHMGAKMPVDISLGELRWGGDDYIFGG